ncbi:hypothetical protein DICPUDRAFT_9842, partial [Dictyostelium purpureum]
NHISTTKEEFLDKIEEYIINGDNLLSGNEEFEGLDFNQKRAMQYLFKDSLERIRQRVLNNGRPVVEENNSNLEFNPPLYNQTVIDAFESKTLLNPLDDLDYNPYKIENYNYTLNNSTVCGLYYTNPNDRSTYYLYNYTSAEEAVESGAYVTHLHHCGYCSTTKDLSSYMAHMDLTSPIRDCAIVTFVSEEISLDCIQHSAGFTHNCALIWLYDALNTRKDCLDICLYDWIMHVPNNVPANSTTLSPCIQCDEDKSGPIFKAVAARTRRDSGLKSAINRPPDSIYNITHYYY